MPRYLGLNYFGEPPIRRGARNDNGVESTCKFEASLNPCGTDGHRSAVVCDDDSPLFNLSASPELFVSEQSVTGSLAHVVPCTSQTSITSREVLAPVPESSDVVPQSSQHLNSQCTHHDAEEGVEKLLDWLCCQAAVDDAPSTEKQTLVDLDFNSVTAGASLSSKQTVEVITLDSDVELLSVSDTEAEDVVSDDMCFESKQDVPPEANVFSRGFSSSGQNDSLEAFIRLRRTASTVPKEVCHHESVFVLEKQTEKVEHAKNLSQSTKLPLPEIKDPNYLPVRLICSSEFCQNMPLLKLMENSYNISFVERDFSVTGPLVSDFDENCLFFADIVVDERTAILVKPLHKLNDSAFVKTLINTVVFLELKYPMCYVLLNVTQVCQPFVESQSTSGMFQNLSRLSIACSLFSSRKHSYNVKLLYAVDSVQLSDLVRKICDAAASASSVWSNKDWYSRPWILDGMSAHEQFLLRFPSINSFSAQVMLATHPLKVLFALSLEDLESTVQWIPVKCLKTFHAMVHTGLAVPSVKDFAPGSLAGRFCTTGEMSNEDLHKEHVVEDNTSLAYDTLSSRTSVHICPPLLRRYQGESPPMDLPWLMDEGEDGIERMHN